VLSDLSLDGLPMFLRGQVSIPDHRELVRELRPLERRAARSGKDAVDHAAGGHDDHANALFGALALAPKPSEVKFVAPIIAVRVRGSARFDHPGWRGGLNPEHPARAMFRGPRVCRICKTPAFLKGAMYSPICAIKSVTGRCFACSFIAFVLGI
jgi:hypothetical protein